MDWCHVGHAESQERQANNEKYIGTALGHIVLLPMATSYISNSLPTFCY